MDGTHQKSSCLPSRFALRAATPFGTTEKAYRVFVEELPPVVKPGEQPTGVRVLTKMGIPIFLSPPRPAAQAILEQVGLQDGKLSFRLRNSGTSHFVAEKIFVRGFGSGGDVVLDQQLNGWYVLAGRTHSYEIAVPDAECARMTTTAVEVQIGKSVLRERLQVPQASCTP
ncbi:MAG: hypothetical protein DMF98_07060 [Acidobacteria bacterium]|nr:MAG: hypothetical protein DMF98_07060 [Acidobacteriota bacterium]